MKENLIHVFHHQINTKNKYIKYYIMVNLLQYINNNEKITGLIDSSLEGTILTKSYTRPDIINIEGVFDSKYMQQKENNVSLNLLNETPQNELQQDIIIPIDSNISKMLDQNDITNTINVSSNGLVPEVLFPPNSQFFPTAKKSPKIENFTNIKIMGADIKIVFLIIFIIISIVLIIKYCP